MSELCCVILAAGEGKRMKSSKPKVMHELLFKPMISWVTDAAAGAGAFDICVVTGHEREQVEYYLANRFEIAVQHERLGTGHAVMAAREFLKENEENESCVLILSGDTPLIKKETLKAFADFHKNNGYIASVMSADFENPFGYGRIVRKEDGSLLKIVEQKDANTAEQVLCEINSGIYCFNIKALLSALDRLSCDNAQKEYYLTDTMEILSRDKKSIGVYKISDNVEILGINDRLQLSEAESIAAKRMAFELMEKGVTIHLPETVLISPNCEISADCEIYPNTIIRGNTVIGEGCIIGPDTLLDHMAIGENCKINSSQCYSSIVGANTAIGPFAHIRPGSYLGKSMRVGNFVEIKNTTFGDNTKISHLTYVGDSMVGSGVNFGCGTVTVNYDGQSKYQTVIGDNAFIGCNANLVAPIKVDSGAYVAAGSTITDDVPTGALAVARARQVIKEGWVEKRIEKMGEKK